MGASNATTLYTYIHALTLGTRVHAHVYTCSNSIYFNDSSIYLLPFPGPFTLGSLDLRVCAYYLYVLPCTGAPSSSEACNAHARWKGVRVRRGDELVWRLVGRSTIEALPFLRHASLSLGAPPQTYLYVSGMCLCVARVPFIVHYLAPSPPFAAPFSCQN